jgi:hypothetical protein
MLSRQSLCLLCGRGAVAADAAKQEMRSSKTSTASATPCQVCPTPTMQRCLDADKRPRSCPRHCACCGGKNCRWAEPGWLVCRRRALTRRRAKLRSHLPRTLQHRTRLGQVDPTPNACTRDTHTHARAHGTTIKTDNVRECSIDADYPHAWNRHALEAVVAEKPTQGWRVLYSLALSPQGGCNCGDLSQCDSALRCMKPQCFALPIVTQLASCSCETRDLV